MKKNSRILKKPKVQKETWIIIGFVLFLVCITVFFVFRRDLSTLVTKIYPSSEPDSVTNIVETLSKGPHPELSKAGYFEKIKKELIDKKENFLEANLSSKEIKYYESGKEILSFPIGAIGRETSWWQTPPGIYTVQGKEETHWSSFGNVYMPWNLQFQGNFFIHGWPYYKSGAPATGNTSAGCIRLETEHAKALYDRVARGATVLIFDDRYYATEFNYDHYIPLEIQAEQYLAIDLLSNEVYAMSQNQKPLAVGKIDRLMHALVAGEYIDMERNITVQSSPYADDPQMSPGDKYKMYDLLFPFLSEWSDEAGYSIASYLGLDRFLELMNTKAESLGMHNTKFYSIREASGANDKETISTAEDLFFMLKYLYVYRPFAYEMSTGRLTYWRYGEPALGRVMNPKIFPGYSDFYGGMYDKETGSTAAVFKLKINGTTRPIAFIALHSEDSLQDILDMRTAILKQRALSD